MTAYRFLRSDDRRVIGDELTLFAQEYGNVVVEQMNTVVYTGGDYAEPVIETIVLVRYETGRDTPLRTDP